MCQLRLVPQTPSPIRRVHPIITSSPTVGSTTPCRPQNRSRLPAISERVKQSIPTANGRSRPPSHLPEVSNSDVGGDGGAKRRFSAGQIMPPRTNRSRDLPSGVLRYMKEKPTTDEELPRRRLSAGSIKPAQKPRHHSPAANDIKSHLRSTISSASKAMPQKRGSHLPSLK